MAEPQQRDDAEQRQNHIGPHFDWQGPQRAVYGAAIGVVGEDPRTEASLEIGRKGCELIVDGMVKKAEDLLFGVQE